MSETYYIQDTLPGMGEELDILNGYTCPWHAEFMAEEGVCRCLENLGRGE
jgi:hypothetical protein